MTRLPQPARANGRKNWWSLSEFAWEYLSCAHILGHSNIQLFGDAPGLRDGRDRDASGNKVEGCSYPERDSAYQPFAFPSMPATARSAVV